IVYGLQYLHSQDPPIVHGRLRSSNVLVTDAGESLLCDYDQARFADDMPADIATNLAPEWARWAAPEHFSFNTSASGAPVDPWAAPSDMFSLGMTIYEILAGHKPFAGTSSRMARDAIQDGDRPDIPDAWKQDAEVAVLIGLMTKCWTHDPGKRPSCSEAVALLHTDQSGHQPQPVSDGGQPTGDNPVHLRSEPSRNSTSQGRQADLSSGEDRS
ncbi:kinase-like protein, partial [Calocera cornea HHB12733]